MPQFQGSREEVCALGAYVKLLRAAESVSARVHQRMTDADLTSSQFGVLEALWHLGPLCQRDIGKKLLKSGGNITMVIDNLEKRHLVERKRDASDRRYITVCLTEAGQQLIAELFPRHVTAVVAELSVLSVAEQEELGRLCRKLGKHELS
ncbi:MarR family winged helix-turn-helix transcriptional regulator [Leptolyngbya sp. FACHB-261]|uniref:MarR family winged helix-turn-helix transcriptional regulator n=1 Tax=Leptolyngbya sp. FACHB-261 TaxID=2692806 RepID=UPI001685966B|nr:MarR family transcriptional regulator [Leptolyngbya sp. FACHB-261]MBD2104716.1 MarR family transcriptional regulator [Leptolyngbya sp. FACHB-261]